MRPEIESPSFLESCTFVFLNKGNVSTYKKYVIDWLDYSAELNAKLENRFEVWLKDKGESIESGNDLNRLFLEFIKNSEFSDSYTSLFTHTPSRVTDALEACRGMVVLSESNKLVAYMTWDMDIATRVEIDIVEVLLEYRKKGVLKKMLETLVNQFSKIHMLTATVLEESQLAFSKLGWKNEYCGPYISKMMKSVKNGLQPQTTLPDGKVIAVCFKDYFQVYKSLEQYSSQMQYYSIECDQKGKLKLPIVIKAFSPDYYVALYNDKKLVAHSRAKYIFKQELVHSNCWLLTIDRLALQEKKCVEAMGVKHQAAKRKGSTININKEKPPKKRFLGNPTLFVSDKKESTSDRQIDRPSSFVIDRRWSL